MNRNKKTKNDPEYYLFGLLCETLLPYDSYWQNESTDEFIFLFTWAIDNYEHAINANSDWIDEAKIRKAILNDCLHKTEKSLGELGELLRLYKDDEIKATKLVILYLVVRFRYDNRASGKQFYKKAISELKYVYTVLDKNSFSKRFHDYIFSDIHEELDTDKIIDFFFKHYPDDHTALYFKAEKYLHNYQINSATNIIEMLLKINPNDLSALSLQIKVSSHYSVSDINKCLQLSEKIISLYPNNPESYYTRVYYSDEIRITDHIVDDIKKIFNITGKIYYLLILRANNYYKHKKYELAYDDFTSAYHLSEHLKKRVRYIDVNYQCYSISAIMSGNYENAINILNQKISSERNNLTYEDEINWEIGKCHFLLAQIYKRTGIGDYKEAINNVKKYYPKYTLNERETQKEFPMFYDSDIENQIANKNDSDEVSIRLLIMNIINNKYGDRVKKKETMKGSIKEKIIEHLKNDHGVIIDDKKLRAYLSKLGYTKNGGPE